MSEEKICGICLFWDGERCTLRYNKDREICKGTPDDIAYAFYYTKKRKMICPYCGRNPVEYYPLGLARKLVEDNGIISEYMNPGGRELEFPFGRIQLSDSCRWCDYEKLKTEIDRLKEVENGE